jgi:cellulose biosynthesis protein BcsQ
MRRVDGTAPADDAQPVADLFALGRRSGDERQGDDPRPLERHALPPFRWRLRHGDTRGLNSFRHAYYDFILLDTPPGLGPLSSMAMLAADWVIVPARPADFDVAGAIKLATLIGGALATLNERLRLVGVLICQVDRRWTLSIDTREALAAAGVHRLRVEISFMVRTGAAPRQGAPTVLLEPDCRLSVAYHELARDLETVLTTEAHA